MKQNMNGNYSQAEAIMAKLMPHASMYGSKVRENDVRLAEEAMVSDTQKAFTKFFDTVDTLTKEPGITYTASKVNNTPYWPQAVLTDLQKKQIEDKAAEINKQIKETWKPVYTPPIAVTKIERISSKEVDPSGKSLNEPGAKADSGKNRVWLCLAGFSNALEKVAEVTTIGAKKYTPNGWAEVSGGYDRYMDAFGRHFLEYGQGKKLDDKEGGIGTEHLAQMIWNLLAAYELSLREVKKNAS